MRAVEGIPCFKQHLVSKMAEANHQEAPDPITIFRELVRKQVLFFFLAVCPEQNEESEIDFFAQLDKGLFKLRSVFSIQSLERGYLRLIGMDLPDIGGVEGKGRAVRRFFLKS